MLVRFGERLAFLYPIAGDRVRLMRGDVVVRELALDEACRLVVAFAPTLAERTAMLDVGVRIEAGGALVRVHRGVPPAPRATFPALRAA